MGRLILIISLLITSLYSLEISRVIDGDTIVADFECNNPILCKNIPVRINDIDTPEMRGKCKKEKVLARKAKLTLERILFNADKVTLEHVTRGKYYRLSADVFADDVNVGKMLILRGHAREYDGKSKRGGWCD